MRYIYALRKKEERSNTDLKKYVNEIKNSLKYLDVEEENYIVVNTDSFEFSFSGCITRGYLQQMGKRLAELGVGKGGFVRQNNKAYAFLSFDESKAEDEQVSVELVDCSTIDFEDEYRRNNMPEWVSFYRKVELSTTHISIKRARDIFGGFYELTKENDVVLLVELKYYYLTNERYNEYLESSDTYDYISSRYPQNSIRKNTCIIEHLYSAGRYRQDLVDLADITFLNVVSSSEKERVISKFNLKMESHIGQQYETNTKGRNQDTNYTFTIHNVGQALATSLREKGEQPFFYFDYGIACGRNKFTLPVDAELPIAENATILLSHVDEDHWCGFRINPEALKCRWVVPQKPGKALKKMLSSVYLSGGSISLYRANGLNIFRIKSVNNCMVDGNEKSKIKSLRAPKTVHENGNALYIFAEHEGKKYKIAVSGDQDYDYQNNNYLKDVNLLVACHHGGKYSWSKKAIVPRPNTDENTLIYSYGQGNTYGHPSEVGEYVKQGWKTEHRTPLDGAYKIDLKLIDNTSLKGMIKADNPMGMEFEV